LKIIDLAGLTFVAASLCGCASMMVAGSQNIQLALTPMTASCDAYQHDVVVGRSDPASQSITVPKSPGSTDILCLASGYKDKRVTIVPDNPGVLAAFLTDFGPAELSAYPGSIQIVMEPADRQGLPR